MWTTDSQVVGAKGQGWCVARRERDEPATGSARLDGGDGSWTKELARSKGAPVVELTGGQHIADLATAAAGFRNEYYGLVGHVREAAEGAMPAPLATRG